MIEEKDQLRNHENLNPEQGGFLKNEFLYAIGSTSFSMTGFRYTIETHP